MAEYVDSDAVDKPMDKCPSEVQRPDEPVGPSGLLLAVRAQAWYREFREIDTAAGSNYVRSYTPVPRILSESSPHLVSRSAALCNLKIIIKENGEMNNICCVLVRNACMIGPSRFVAIPSPLRVVKTGEDPVAGADIDCYVFFVTGRHRGDRTATIPMCRNCY